MSNKNVNFVTGFAAGAAWMVGAIIVLHHSYATHDFESMLAGFYFIIGSGIHMAACVYRLVTDD